MKNSPGYLALRKELLKRKKFTAQALSARVNKRKRESALPISTQEATCLIAHDEGVPLDRYLDLETIRALREAVPRSEAAALPAARKKPSQRQSAEPAVIRFRDLDVIDPILKRAAKDQAVEMARVYGMLYILENSIRELVHRVMQSRHGDDWWESCVGNNVKKRVAKRMQDDERDQWHQRRGDRPIDYTDLNDLPSIVTNNERDFAPAILPRAKWFEALIDGVYKSRCVVCHMNPLHPDNIAGVKVRLKEWTKQIRGKLSNIPS